MRGIGLRTAADVSGLAFDRIFMITETDGRSLPDSSTNGPLRLPFPRWVASYGPDGSALVRLPTSRPRMRRQKWKPFTARIAPAASASGIAAFSPVTYNFAGSVGN